MLAGLVAVSSVVLAVALAMVVSFSVWVVTLALV